MQNSFVYNINRLEVSQVFPVFVLAHQCEGRSIPAPQSCCSDLEALAVASDCATCCPDLGTPLR